MKCRSSLLANNLVKRLAAGKLIHPTQTKNSKDVKTVKAPQALAKFFTTPKEAV